MKEDKKYKELRDTLWKIHSLHMDPPIWSVLEIGSLFLLGGLANIYPFNAWSIFWGFFLAFGLLMIWVFIYSCIVHDAVRKRLEWVDNMLLLRTYFLKDRKIRKKYTKEQLDKMDTLLNSSTRPSEEELEKALGI